MGWGIEWRGTWEPGRHCYLGKRNYWGACGLIRSWERMDLAGALSEHSVFFLLSTTLTWSTAGSYKSLPLSLLGRLVPWTFSMTLCSTFALLLFLSSNLFYLFFTTLLNTPFPTTGYISTQTEHSRSYLR